MIRSMYKRGDTNDNVSFIIYFLYTWKQVKWKQLSSWEKFNGNVLNVWKPNVCSSKLWFVFFLFMIIIQTPSPVKNEPHLFMSQTRARVIFHSSSLNIVSVGWQRLLGTNELYWTCISRAECFTFFLCRITFFFQGKKWI